MGPNYIALAVPFFFLLIGIELWVARRRGRRVYRFADAITDLGCGVTQQIVVLFVNGFLFAGYLWMYRHARVVDLGRHPVVAWAVALVGVDFIYYWWHRTSHRVNLLWAAHAVHHQSEDYNLAVALRQAVLTPFTSLPFSLPLAMVGVPPLAYIAADSLSTLYQFWIHTELVGRLGPLEKVLNTPSHHRVHHARNPEYIDRNYGAILILWDRLFGTFAPERARPIYGITKPFRSFNAMWAQLQPVADLLADRGARAPVHRTAPGLAGAAGTSLRLAAGRPRRAAARRRQVQPASRPVAAALSGREFCSGRRGDVRSDAMERKRTPVDLDRWSRLGAGGDARHRRTDGGAALGAAARGRAGGHDRGRDHLLRRLSPGARAARRQVQSDEWGSLRVARSRRCAW